MTNFSDRELLPLRVYTQGKLLAMEAFLELACALTESLVRVHSLGIIHRGIQSDRVFVARRPFQVFLSGTHLHTEDVASAISKVPLMLDSGVVDDIAYMAPEQMGRIELGIDERTDIYSAGVVLYELACQRLPHEENDFAAWVHAHIAKAVVSPLHWNERLPEMVAAVLMKCIEKDPARRYQSAFGLYFDLEQCKAMWSERQAIGSFTLGTRDVSDIDSVLSRLWDRDEALQQLHEAVISTLTGGSPVISLTGETGAGKSTLLNAFVSLLPVEDVIATTASCDIRPWTVPYGVVAKAFRRILRGLLTRSEEELHQWQRRFEQELETTSHFMLDILPELEHFLPAVQEGGLTQPVRPTLSQVADGFLTVLKALGRRQQPILLCLDDLQWIDDTTLQLLLLLVTTHETPYVAWILSFDDTNFTGRRQWAASQDRLQRRHEVTNIQLKGISEAAIRKILGTVYPAADRGLDGLSAEVFRRTAGNPFLVKSTLLNLHRHHHVRFDIDEHKWTWELPADSGSGARRHRVVDGEPLQFAAGKQSEAGRILQWAAVLGRQFEMKLLQTVSRVPVDALAPALQYFQRENLIHTETPPDGSDTETVLAAKFRFANEAVHRECLETLDHDSRSEMELLSGLALADDERAYREPAMVFEIANHLFAGSDKLKEHGILVNWHLWAAQEASVHNDYALTVLYCRRGLGWIDKTDEYTNRQGMEFELRLCFIRANCMNGETEHVEEDYHRLLAFAANAAQRQAVLLELARFYFSLGNGEAALINALRFIPLDWPERAAMTSRLIRQAQIYGWSLDKKDTYTGDQPDGRGLSALVSARQLASVGKHEAAREYAQQACNLQQVRDDSFATAACYYTMGSFITPWTASAEEAQQQLTLATEHARSAGDVVLAAQAQLGLVGLQFLAGKPIHDLLTVLNEGLSMIRPLRNSFLESVYESFQASLLLSQAQGVAAPPVDSEVFGRVVPFLRGWLLLFWLTATFVSGNKEKALQFTSRFFEDSDLTPDSFPGYADALLLRGLLLANPDSLAANRMDSGTRVEFHQLLIQLRRQNSKTGACGHLIALMEAEQVRVNQENSYKAMELYEQASAQALAVGKRHYSAISNERAGYLALARNNFNYARALFTAAIDDYDAWGARRRARQLEEQHALVLRRGQGERRRRRSSPLEQEGSLSQDVSQRMDWLLVSRAAQALSREVVLEKLLRRLMQLVMESAGAQRGFILLVRGPQLHVEAFASVDVPAAVVSESLPVSSMADELAVSIVEYTYRTQEDTVLANAANAIDFTDDKYIREKNPKSILCVPILNRQQVMGVLYLENNRLTNAFTENRLELVKVLAAQAAISFENAFLYRSLEQKVLERTEALERSSQELTKANQLLEQVNADLRQSESMRRQLLANVSHDLRTPITLIAGYAEALANGMAHTDEEIKQFAMRIQDKSQVLNHLIEDLFNLVRLEARQVELTQETCTAEEFLVSAVMRFQSDVEQAGQRFQWYGVDEADITQEGTWLRVDRDRLHQVFANIIYNAMKHTPVGGTVTVGLDRTSADTVTYRISDTGAGIPAEDLPYIFDRFYKADRSRTAKPGSGLGLAIAKQVIELHAGRIDVTSKLGVGSTFSITLPTMGHED